MHRLRTPETAEYEPGTTTGAGDAVARDLVTCEHFSIREWTVLREGALASESDEMRVLMVVDGDAVVRWGGAAVKPLRIRGGDTLLLPAGLERAELEAVSDVKLLEVTPLQQDPDRRVTRLPVVPSPGA